MVCGIALLVAQRAGNRSDHVVRLLRADRSNQRLPSCAAGLLARPLLRGRLQSSPARRALRALLRDLWTCKDKPL